jgi:Virulence factor membrane-bound polymerase, C-terminal
MQKIWLSITRIATWRTPGTDVQTSRQVWQLVWILMLSCSWVIPNRYSPLTEFYADFWIAVCLLIGLSALLWIHRAPRYEWPAPAIVLLALSIIPWLQWAGGLVVSRGQASLSFIYLLGAAVVCATGFMWHRWRGWSALSWMLTAVLIGALVNTGILLTQYTGLYPYNDIDGIGALIFRIGSNQRPTGNIAQANIAGTLCIWGALAAWWLMADGKIRWPIMALSSAYLMLAMTLTQSRIALINLVFITGLALCLAWCVGRSHRNPTSRLTKFWGSQHMPSMAWCLQPLFWLLWSLLWTALLVWVKSEFDHGQGVREGVFQDHLRSLTYMSFGRAALAQPWFGYGMTHLTSVQMVAAPDGIALNAYFFHSHNLFLDLLLWFGLPLGGMLILGLFLLGWALVRTARCSRSIAALAMVFVFILHAMVELPHMWGIMLLPCCWLIGTLYAAGQNRCNSSLKLPVVIVSRKLAIALTGLLITFLVVLWTDYYAIQREFWTLRMDNARIGPRGLDRVEPAILLNHIENRLRLGRLSSDDLENPNNLSWIAQAAMGFPSPSTHFLYIKALALHTSSELTEKEMRRLNRLTTKRALQKFEKDWEIFRASHPKRNFPIWVRSGALLSQDIQLPAGISSEAMATPPEE